MPVPHYKIWEWGDAVGRGAMKSCHVGVSGIAKTATDAQPYALANEYICSALARVLRLPIPPSFVVIRDEERYHVSLNFNLSGEDLPPANAALVVQNCPLLSWGIILFDIWVANTDRHPQNLAYDTDDNRVQIFDHSHAFMNGRNGREHLESHEDDLGIGRGGNRTGHCLANEVTDLEGMAAWAARISAVPRYYIEEVVRDAADLGLSEDDVGFCEGFLVRRQDRIPDLVSERREAFPKLAPDLWTAASQNDAEQAPQDEAEPVDEADADADAEAGGEL